MDRLRAMEASATYDASESGPSGVEPDPAVKALCQDYLRASKRERALIRNEVSGRRRVLVRLLAMICTATEQVRTTEDEAWLKIGAAAGAIHGGQLDYRDYLVALAELAIAAEEVGFDSISTFEMMGGGLPKDFDTYPEVRDRRSERRGSG